MRRPAPWLAPALGTLLCAAGAAVSGWAEASAPDDFGWYAYSPPGIDIAYDSDLLASFDDPFPLLWTNRHLLGAVLLVAGLVVLGGWAGRLLGRRWGVRGGPVVVALGALAGLLLLGGAVLVVTGDAPAVVVYGGSYQPMSGVDATGAPPGNSPVRVSGVQLAGLGTAVLGAVLAAAVATAVTVVRTGPGVTGRGVPGPGRAVGWLVAVAGVLMAVPGLVLAARAPAVAPELVFLSPEQYDQLVTASWLADAGRVLVAVGALLVAGAAPWLAGRGRPVRRVGAAALGAGAGLAVLGAGLLWSGRAAGRAVEGAVPGAVAGPGQWTGLVLVLVGGALLGAGVRRVTGRRLAG